MLKWLHIQSFRGFDVIQVDELARVTLVAGRNNVGKTALLEAAYLLLRPEEPMIVKDLLSASRKVPPGYVATLGDVWPIQAFEGRSTIVLSGEWEHSDPLVTRKIRSQLSLNRPTSVTSSPAAAQEHGERIADSSVLASNGGPKEMRVDYLMPDMKVQGVGLRDGGGS